MSTKPEPALPSERASEPASFLTSIFVMLAMLAAAEVFYRDTAVDLRMQHSANYITAKRLEYETDGGDIVVTGDSRMYHAFNPHLMQETLQQLKGKTYTAFDFGIPSGTTPIFMMVAKLGMSPGSAASISGASLS